MAFRNNTIATMWKLRDTDSVIKFYDKYAEIQISTRKLNKKTNEYETDFSGKVRCVGKAFETLKSFTTEEKQRVKLIDVEVNNKYDKTTKTMYTNFICWELEPYVYDENKTEDKKSEPAMVEVKVSEDDDFPF